MRNYEMMVTYYDGSYDMFFNMMVTEVVPMIKRLRAQEGDEKAIYIKVSRRWHGDGKMAMVYKWEK